MYHQYRDIGINHITTCKAHCCYGMGLGIIILDDPYPGFSGNVRNASAFSYPIQYEITEGVDNYTLVFKEDKSPCLAPIQRVMWFNENEHRVKHRYYPARKPSIVEMLLT